MKSDGYRSLGKAEAGEMARRAAEGDAEARWELANSVAPLIRKVAARVARRAGRPGLLDDLANAGLAATWERCHLYDPDRGSPCVFAERAAWNGFRDVLCDLGYAVRVPAWAFDGRLGKAAAAGKAVADRLKNAMVPAIHLSARPTRFDIEADASGELDGDDLDRAELLDRLCDLRKLLTRRERRTLALRYRLGMTHAEAGKLMGISHQASQQAERRALARLRAGLGEVGV